MQAMSFAVHIPLVCFGIAFPAMFLFVEGLYLRTGDETYKRPAVKWSKVALTLFDDGIAAFQRAIAVDSFNVDALNELGILRAQSGQNDEAARWYRRAVALEPLPEGFNAPGVPGPPSR